MADTAGPLLVLARKLLSLGTPSVSVLIARLSQFEEYDEFVLLVRNFLPEREVDILHNPAPAEQIAAFASYFEDRYFPLHPSFRDGEQDEYYAITCGIPVMVRGMSWEDYHELATDWRLGNQIMTFLVESPYEEGAARIALAEALAEHVPAALIQQVPDGGFTIGDIRLILGNTPYNGLMLWANMMGQDTGNFFLDNDEEMLYSGAMPIEWYRDTVEELARHWLQAVVIEDEAYRLVAWLEEEPVARFEELLTYIQKGVEA